MDHTEATTQGQTGKDTPEVELDVGKAKTFQAEMEMQQNLLLGILGGLGAALLGAAIWAAVTVTTEYQIGWMAVGVGFLVGAAVRVLGKGISSVFGIVGAACALLGCLLGNLFSVSGFVSIQESVPFMTVVIAALTQPALAVELLKATFSPMDLLFYGIAVYEGYKFSFRQVKPAELAVLAKGA